MNTPKTIDTLHVKLFVDGAHSEEMAEFAKLPYIHGFTTNPSLMREAGVIDYTEFASKVVPLLHGKPISFEVFSDDFSEMERQAKIIASWGENVYVKIPITNTTGASSIDLITRLSSAGVKLNITLLFTAEQVREVVAALKEGTPAIVSVFAGRVADTGVDPVPLMKECKALCATNSSVELLWASCREIYNIYQAEEVGADIITVPPKLLKSLDGIGTDLTSLSLSGVRKFYEDGKAAQYSL